MMIKYRELIHFAKENFQALVVDQSTHNRTESWTDSLGTKCEETKYFQGSKVVGKCLGWSGGCKYFIRID